MIQGQSYGRHRAPAPSGWIDSTEGLYRWAVGLIFRLGWRNLWRNLRRSVLTLGSIAVAFAILIVVIGIIEGVAQQLLTNGTRTMLGHVQVHAQSYLPDRGLHDTIGGHLGTDTMKLVERIEMAAAATATARVFGFALLSTGPRSAGAQLVGIDPAREARVTTLQNAIVHGRGLEGAPPLSVVLGQTLADEIGATIGSEIAVVTQAADGSMGNEILTVTGILRTGLIAVDRSLALLRLDDLQALLALPAARVHEIAVRIDAAESADDVVRLLQAAVQEPSALRIESWRTLAPQIAEYLTLTRSSHWMMLLIVGTFAAFGVLNTMLMAVFERTHEIGVLAALGLRPRQILATVLAESLCLAVVGLTAGLALGSLAMWYLQVHGWDLSPWTQGVTMAGVLFDPVLRASWDWPAALQAALSLAAITVVAAFIPALRAARMRPVEALAAPVE